MKILFFSTMLISALIVAGLGVIVKYYRAYWLISGYNTMSKDKKKNVDVEGLARFIGNACIVMAAMLLFATILFMLNLEVLAGILLFLIIPFSAYLIIGAQRYDGNTWNPDGTMKRKSKIIVGTISGFLILTTIGLGALFYYSNKPAEFAIGDDYFQIKGIYGETIQLEDISDIRLDDQPPDIVYRKNGYSMGSIKKGYFRLEGLPNAKLFVDTSVPPFIYISKDDKLVVLNCEEEKQTRVLFQELESVMGKNLNPNSF